jgi:hypothetical protein
MAGFLGMRSLYRDRIRTITFRKFPKVSGYLLRNSRFLETHLRDRGIKPLRGRCVSEGRFGDA